MNQDNVEADNGREVTNQLERLSLAAGEFIYLNGTLDSADLDVAQVIRNIYAGLASVNHKIEGRDLYKATNGAMTNYATSRKMINEELLTIISSLSTQLTEVKPRIEKILES